MSHPVQPISAAHLHCQCCEDDQFGQPDSDHRCSICTAVHDWYLVSETNIKGFTKNIYFFPHLFLPRHFWGLRNWIIVFMYKKLYFYISENITQQLLLYVLTCIILSQLLYTPTLSISNCGFNDLNFQKKKKKNSHQHTSWGTCKNIHTLKVYN